MAKELTLVIGTKRFSSWSLRPWLALRQVGADFDEVEIQLRQDDTKARILEWSPSGKVPLLVHGLERIWDSLAICEYAAELFPALWPSERAARAIARAVSAEMHSGFQALRQNCPMDLGLEQDTDLTPEIQADVARITRIWNDCRARFGAGGPFLFGGFSIADAMFAPVVTRFISYRVALDPVSKAYCATIEALPALAEWRRGAV